MVSERPPETGRTATRDVREQLGRTEHVAELEHKVLRDEHDAACVRLAEDRVR
jgi:hypothetical protein